MEKNHNVSDFGVKPLQDRNYSPHIASALVQIAKIKLAGQKAVLLFEPGIYEFRWTQLLKEHIISPIINR